MAHSSQEIGYLDSFSADTSVVPAVITRLIDDLNKVHYKKDEIDEIVLSMDEAITNAIQETLKKRSQTDQTTDENMDRRDITIRYTITGEEFDATIIDHGKGLDLFNIFHIVPDCTSSDYKTQIISYATESEKCKIKVRINGREIPLRGIGAGLKIIINFMDAITIDLIDKEKVLSSSVSEHTDGTIFNMKRSRRHR
ncbi:MAG: ATP-binding protein [Spirochaetes bacterium]|nr:ATP-binding protein [Spirochaetota bacterium]